MTARARVLVLGGGFAGRCAAKRLAKAGGRDVSVRLVDAKPASEFSPLYPDLISGRIAPEGVRQPLDEFCRDIGAEFVRAEVTHIDPSAVRVETTVGELRADFLVLCLGCETYFYGDAEMRRRALGLKSVADAAAIREAAAKHIQTFRDRDEPFHLVVVGGGYTGIETASHLANLLRQWTRVSRNQPGRLAKVIVLEKASRVLETVPARIAAWVVCRIAQQGIGVRTGVSVEEFIGDGAVRLTDGSTLANALIVWAAGVTPGPASASLDSPKVARRRLAVDKHLRLPGRERVFAAGDLAGATPPGRTAPLRMGVQFSRVGGMIVAGNVLATIRGRKLTVFDPVDPGYVVPLADGLGVGNILGQQCYGRVPYYLHYFMSVYRSWTWPNRVAVLRDALGLPPASG